MCIENKFIPYYKINWFQNYLFRDFVCIFFIASIGTKTSVIPSRVLYIIVYYYWVLDDVHRYVHFL